MIGVSVLVVLVDGNSVVRFYLTFWRFFFVVEFMLRLLILKIILIPTLFSFQLTMIIISVDRFSGSTLSLLSGMSR